MAVQQGADYQIMLDEVMEGLHQPQKRLPAKYFYDERGSELFERITRLEEYYPTRTERKILDKNIEEIVSEIGEGAVIVELGSGSSEKVRLLLDQLADPVAYVPVDISDTYLNKVVQRLRIDYPNLLVRPVWADYTRSFKLPDFDEHYRRQVVFFPGSTIGNFEPEQAREFLHMLSLNLKPGAGLLVGVDLKKDPAILERAYNDDQGLTAAFNKNMLLHLNRELGTDFDVSSFRHRAFYNGEKGRIEMHLVSLKNQQVRIGGETISIGEEESIHTENSYKYSIAEFKNLVQEWFCIKKVWTDEHDLFSVHYAELK